MGEEREERERETEDWYLRRVCNGNDQWKAMEVMYT